MGRVWLALELWDKLELDSFWARPAVTQPQTYRTGSTC